MVKTISVTKRDIEKGVPRSPCNCPIANAVNRALKESRAFADPTFITIGNMKRKTPDSASRFISQFDAGDPVRPFRFHLDIPAKYLKRAKRARR